MLDVGFIVRARIIPDTINLYCVEPVVSVSDVESFSVRVFVVAVHGFV
jgi:hypothetical protein